MAIRFFNPDDPQPGKVPVHLSASEIAEVLAKGKAEYSPHQLEKDLDEILDLLAHPEKGKSLSEVVDDLEKS